MKTEIKLPFVRLAILAAGGYLVWRNRFRVQRFLEANGISTPWMNGSIGEAVQSGAAKVLGAAENEINYSDKNESAA